MASQLLDAIRAKEGMERLSSILDGLTTVQPELAANRDSESFYMYTVLCTYVHVSTYIIKYSTLHVQLLSYNKCPLIL